MVMWISGIASVPGIYTGVGDKKMRLRDTDIAHLAQKANGRNFVMDHAEHDVSDVRGVILSSTATPDGRLYYEALINDYECEYEINRLRDMGKVPNVSVFVQPSEGATITLDAEHSTTDDPVYVASSWDFLHLSLVSRGACSDAEGCGVFDFKLLNSACPRKGDAPVSRGKKMTTDANSTPAGTAAPDFSKELAQLKLELSGLTDSLKAKDAELEQLKSFKAQQEQTLAASQQAELDALKAKILQIDPNAPLDGLDKTALGVVLSAYGARPKPSFNSKANSGDNKTPGQLALQAAYAKRQEKFKGFAGMRKA